MSRPITCVAVIMRDVTVRFKEVLAHALSCGENAAAYPPMAKPFFTIGHSTRPMNQFVDLLRQANVDLVVDVRSVPRSRTNPHYNHETVSETLSAYQIGYAYMAALGGRRAKARDVPAAMNAFWEHHSFHNYADYAMTGAFRSGLAELREAGHARRCAIMCAEAVWWRCHRRIIADYLLAARDDVFHILAANRIEPARMTDAASLQPDGTLTYPADACRDATAGKF